MVMQPSALEVNFDLERAQCNWTKTRTAEVRVYMELQNDWIWSSVLRSLG